MVKLIRVIFTRHSERKDSNKTGLTQKGLNSAKQQGIRRAKEEFKVKRYSGDFPRVLSSAKKAQLGHNLTTQTKYKLRVRKVLSTPTIKKNSLNQLINIKFKGDKKAATIAWLEGKLSEKIILKPNTFLKKLIKNRLGFGKKLIRIGAKDIVLENFTHQEIMLGLVGILTGKKFDRIAKIFDVEYLESFEIKIYSNGRTIDITKNLDKILQN